MELWYTPFYGCMTIDPRDSRQEDLGSSLMSTARSVGIILDHFIFQELVKPGLVCLGVNVYFFLIQPPTYLV